MDAADVRGLLGLLLADGSLVRYRSPSGGYVQLTLTAGASESAFLEDKVAEFRQFLPTQAQIVPYKTAPRANGRTTIVLRFRVSTTKLRLIHNLLYPGGERRVTSTALEMLGARAAAWLWAEGARPRRDGSVELDRVGGSDHEARLIQQWLQTLTGAESQVLAHMVRPRLLFPESEARKIRNALIDYAPPSRVHLFREEMLDVSAIRSLRTELLLGEGEADPQGRQEAAVA